MNGHKVLERTGALALILSIAVATATAATEQPLVRAASGFESERAAAARRDLADAGITVATEKQTAITPGKNTAAGSESVSCCAHYVYSGYTELFDDLDYDGFHSYLRINVDIDTDYFESDVYLEVFLRGSTGGWLRIYESDVFAIYGTSAFDDYEVETELLSGFRADYYDVLVEVYDAYSGDLVATYGPLDDSAFALLPLEDVNRDGAIAPPVVASYGGGGGGTLSFGALAILAWLAATRRRRYSACSTRNLS